MPAAHDILFRTLADPTRRAIFERLCRWRKSSSRCPAGAGRHLTTGRLEAPRDPEACRPCARPSRRPPNSLQRAARRPGSTDRLDEPNGQLLAKPVRPPRRNSTQKDGPIGKSATQTLSVVIEREMPYPPEKIWRALTQPHLIEEWLMKGDFSPVLNHQFKFTADWGAVDCQVLEVEPNRTLAYAWGAYGLESVVTWTLTATSTGTSLRMEQSGFLARSASRHTQVPRLAGLVSLRTWSRSWRGWTPPEQPLGRQFRALGHRRQLRPHHVVGDAAAPSRGSRTRNRSPPAPVSDPLPPWPPAPAGPPRLPDARQSWSADG